MNKFDSLDQKLNNGVSLPLPLPFNPKQVNMKKLPDIVKYYDLNCIGDITQNNYRGGFRFKVILTHDERFKIERAYKQMLPNDIGVNQEITIRAAGIAELEQRIVEAPQWWKDARNGRDLVDSSPIYDLIVAVEQQYKAWQEELGKVAESTDGSNQ